jgi:hypothetical protein
MPWAAVAVSFLSPSTVLSRSSSGMTMPLSTSSAEAPLQTTRTEMMSSAKVGKNWMFIRVRLMTPRISIPAISRLASSGCRTKTAIRPVFIGRSRP